MVAWLHWDTFIQCVGAYGGPGAEGPRHGDGAEALESWGGGFPFLTGVRSVQPGSWGRGGALWKPQAGEGVDMVEAGCSLEEVLFIPTFPI